MDTQLKRGLLEICVLKILTYGDSYGYQIVKDVSKIIKISESTLYPILKRLENSNFLVVYSVEHKGRLRKYYKITNEGLDKIKEFVNDWGDVMKIYKFIKEGLDE